MSKAVASRSAFSLVEVTLALGIATFCLVAISGLLLVGMNSYKASVRETAAFNILSAVVSDLRGTPKGSPTSAEFGISTTSSTTVYLGEDGAPAAKAGSPFRLQCTLLPAGTGRGATMGHLTISWPAEQDDPAKASGFVESFIALDRN